MSHSTTNSSPPREGDHPRILRGPLSLCLYPDEAFRRAEDAFDQNPMLRNMTIWKVTIPEEEGPGAGQEDSAIDYYIADLRRIPTLKFLREQYDPLITAVQPHVHLSRPHAKEFR